MKYCYTAVLIPKESGKGYFCRVPDLPGCITTGDDLIDAMEQIMDAASCWLVFAEDQMEAIPDATPQSKVPVSENAVLSVLLIDTSAYREAMIAQSLRESASRPA